MTALLHMLSQNTSSKASSVQEDALLAVSTLIDGNDLLNLFLFEKIIFFNLLLSINQY